MTPHFDSFNQYIIVLKTEWFKMCEFRFRSYAQIICWECASYCEETLVICQRNVKRCHPPVNLKICSSGKKWKHEEDRNDWLGSSVHSINRRGTGKYQLHWIRESTSYHQKRSPKSDANVTHKETALFGVFLYKGTNLKRQYCSVVPQLYMMLIYLILTNGLIVGNNCFISDFDNFDIDC